MKIAHISTVDLSIRYLLLNQLLTIQQAGHEVVAISAAGPHVREVEAAGIRHIAVKMTRSITPLRDLVALFRLTRVLRREKFDLVHTHTPKGGLLGQYAAFLARTPIRMHTIHGLFLPDRPKWRWVFVMLERLTMLFSHHNLSQNPEDVAIAIEERICRPDRVELLGNGIDVTTTYDPRLVPAGERERTRAELGLAPHHKVVGIVARFVAEKGYRELLDAAKLVIAEEPDARFLLIGGEEAEKADAMHPSEIAERGLAGHVLFLGHRTDLRRLFASMDVFTLPSHREGFPRAAMEAAAMGLAQVVTDIRGCRQVVDDGVNGYLVPVGDAPALAKALLDLLRDADKRKRFGAAARAKAEKEFDERIVFARVLDAYRRLEKRL